MIFFCGFSYFLFFFEKRRGKDEKEKLLWYRKIIFLSSSYFFLERNANNKADENSKNVFLSIFIIVQNLVIVESIGIEIK
jgi:hypothetical protein